MPLAAEPFQWFAEARKKWELRRDLPRFAPRHTYAGRLVELRLGYRDPRLAIWKTVVSVVRAGSLEEFFSRVPFADVLPTATSTSEAIRMASDYVGLHDAPRPVVGIKLRSVDATELSLDDQFVADVVAGRKRATVRQGHREVRLGPCEFSTGHQRLAVVITDVRTTEVARLSEMDALEDGFNNVDELRSALDHYYPGLHLNDSVTQIRFRFVGDSLEGGA